MPSSNTWSALAVRHEHVPTLLFKGSFHSSGYRIEFTDLCRVWAEQLSRGEIIQRASNAGGSIDPGEDEKQFSIFLGKIESALSGDDRTYIGLCSRNDNGTELSMEVSAPLPHPLPDFTWTIHLQRLPESYVASALITPLVLQASKLQAQVTSLINELQEKDRVISKICDRLETSGNDLTTVFPGVSNIKTSRKKSQREQLAKHVKGLADFNEATWRDQLSRSVNGSKLGHDVVADVFNDLPQASDLADTSRLDNWWNILREQRATVGVNRNGSNHGSQRDVDNYMVSQGGESMEDEFQRQGTPPHLKAAGNECLEERESSDPVDARSEVHQAPLSQQIQPDDESTTDDEDDLDAPLNRSKSSQAPRATDERETPTNDNSSFPKKKLGMIGSRSSRASASPAKETSSSPQPRRKLGMIGSRSEARAADAEDSAAVSASSQSKPAKTGMMGGKRQIEEEKVNGKQSEPSAAQEVVKEQSPRPLGKSSPEKTPEAQETEEERADKKRDQLKRELEEKAKAPVKKKRKF